MSRREIHIYDDTEGLTEAAGERFIEIAKDAIENHESFSVALSGGSTPRGLYMLLASEKYRSAIDWKRVSFFFGDERKVPSDSERSNYRMARETLLAPLGISEEHIHPWQTELNDVEEAAARYEEDLRKYFERSGRRLDLILLGLGDDAHTASLFPHTAALHEIKRLAAANWVAKLDEHRLTMTLPVINSAAHVMFLISGAAKASALVNVLEGEFSPDDYPAQLVQPGTGQLIWLIDRDAAAALGDI